MMEDLSEAVKVAEAGLLHLKRTRLLKEIALAQSGQNEPASTANVARTYNKEDEDAAEPEASRPDQPLQSSSSKGLVQEHRDRAGHEGGLPTDWREGDCCRFKHTDGRWYTGNIVTLEGLPHVSDRQDDHLAGQTRHHCRAIVSFAHPRVESMQVRQGPGMFCWALELLGDNQVVG